MKKSFRYLLTSTLVAFVLAGIPSVHAADSTNTSETAPAKTKKTTYPFYGTVDSVSAAGMTVSLKKKEGTRVLKTDDKTQIEVNGKPGTLADIKPGNYAHGTLHKDKSGAEIILKAKFDPEAPNKDKAEAAVASTASTASTTATNAVADAGKKAKKAKKSATNAVDSATSTLPK